MECFSIRAADVEGRIDASYYKREYTALVNQIELSKFTKVPFQEIIDEIAGGATPDVDGNSYTDSSGIPFLRVQNIDDTGVLLQDVKFIKNEVHQGPLKRSRLKPGDLVFTITGRIGSVAVYRFEGEANINQHSVRIHLKKEYKSIEIIPEYIALFFNTAMGRKLTFRSTTGATRPALDYKAIAKFPILLPDVKTQSALIQQFQSAIKAKAQKENEARSLLNSVTDLLLEKLDITLPGPVNRLCFVTTRDSVVGTRLDPSPYHPNRINAIEQVSKSAFKSVALSNIVNFRRDLVTVKDDAVTYVGLENIESNTGRYVKTDSERETFGSAFTFEKGDILFPKLRPYLNKVYVAEFRGVCSTEFHVLTPTKCEALFLSTFLRTPLILRQTSYLMTGNTLPRLQTNEIENLLIPLPPRELQKKLDIEILQRMTKAEALRVEAGTVIEQAKKDAEKIILGC